MRRQTISTLRKHIENALRFHKRIYRRQMVPHSILRFLNLPYSSCYMTVMYLLAKSMYLANVVGRVERGGHPDAHRAGQFRLLNWFMLPAQTTEYTSFYGYSALLSLMNGTEWGESGMFPRVTICDFDMRKLGDVQRYSVQCVLVINMFNEKIFVFLWMWYVGRTRHIPHHPHTQVRRVEHTHSYIIRVLDGYYDIAMLSTRVCCASTRVGRHAVRLYR